MTTNKIHSLKLFVFLTAIAFSSICSLFWSCNGDETSARTCSPAWATWEVTFPENATDAEKSNLKAAFEDSIKNLVMMDDADGNTCRIIDTIWIDIDKTHSKLQVCVQCQDKSGKARYDSGAIRPPSSVKPPAGLSTKLVESIATRDLTCSPVWASWELTFPEGISDADRNNQKSAFEEAVKGFVNTTDEAGNTCHISGTNWRDNDATHSTVIICIECVDREQRPIGDTTAVRPPSGVRPPAGIIARLLQ